MPVQLLVRARRWWPAATSVIAAALLAGVYAQLGYATSTPTDTAQIQSPVNSMRATELPDSS